MSNSADDSVEVIQLKIEASSDNANAEDINAPDENMKSDPDPTENEVEVQNIEDSSQLEEEYDLHKSDEMISSDDETLITKKRKRKPKNADSNKTAKRSYTQKYKKEWEQIPSVKPWISESVHGELYFYCRFCKKDYRCSNGKSEVYKHMAAMRHKKNMVQPQITIAKTQKRNIYNVYDFKGLLCPVFTPFEKTRRKDVNYKLIQPYAKFLRSCGIKGVLVNDVIGEGMSLSIEERMKALEAWCDYCKQHKMFIMVQVGMAPLKEVIALAKHAEQHKVDAILVLPDLYHRPKTHLDLIRYIKVLSNDIRNTPLFYHHYPKFTNLDLDMKQLLLDITGEVDNFIGIVYNSADLDESLEVMELNPEKYLVFLGTDEGMMGAVTSGFQRIMGKTFSIFPKLAENIYVCTRNGDINSAKVAQDLLRKATLHIYSHGEQVPALKAAMSLITKLPMEVVRDPLQTVWEGHIMKMEEKLRETGII